MNDGIKKNDCFEKAFGGDSIWSIAMLYKDRNPNNSKKITGIRIIRGELPLEIEDLEDLIAGLNSRLEKFEAELGEINDNILANNNTVSLATDAIEKYEIQLKEIKNNREFTSLTKEVEYQKISAQLEEILNL